MLFSFIRNAFSSPKSILTCTAKSPHQRGLHRSAVHHRLSRETVQSQEQTSPPAFRAADYTAVLFLIKFLLDLKFSFEKKINVDFLLHFFWYGIFYSSYFLSERFLCRELFLFCFGVNIFLYLTLKRGTGGLSAAKTKQSLCDHNHLWSVLL